MAYDGAATVPMAQPLTWRKCLRLKLKLLSISTWFIRVINTLVGGVLSLLFSRLSFRAVSPSVCLMLEHSDLTSNVTRMALWGSVFKSFILFRKSVMSLMLDFTCAASGCI